MTFVRLKLFVVLVRLIFSIHVTSGKTVYFKVERTSFCCGSTSLMKPTKNTTFTIARHNLTIVGAFDLIEDIKNPIELHIKTDKCSATTSKCSDYNYSKVPGVCKYFTKLPFQKKGLGDYLTPPMRCPVKKGTYLIDLMVSLEQFGYLPIDTSVKYQVRIMLYEAVKGKKNRMIVCLDANIRAMESSSRGRTGKV